MCDTFVSTTTATADGSIIFGKNSDREPNEAQVLEFHPRRNHQRGDLLKCTHISIPQIEQTLGVLISRPFWMWGAEMGANEKGVVIGNEAVFTRMPYRKTGVLTGMDLLRLALERADTAEAALEMIVALLSDFGQGGICGYRDKKLTYHNSFIICDAREAWVLETADNLWAALKIGDCYSISNGLTIGESYDRAHPDLILHARKMGWLKRGETFHFARTYSDWLYTTFSGSRSRQACSIGSLTAAGSKVDVLKAINVLRSHGDGIRTVDQGLIAKGLCMHAGNGLTRNAQTTGSLVAHLAGGDPTFWTTGTSAPCTSLFKPVWLGDKVLPNLGPTPGGTCDPASYWWQHELFHRMIMNDYSRMNPFLNEQREFEQTLIDRSAAIDRGQRFSLTEEAFDRSRELVQKWKDQTRTIPVSMPSRWLFRNYWQKQNRQAEIPDWFIEGSSE